MRTRLDAFLAHTGHGTRSSVRKVLRAGRVRLDGVVHKQHKTVFDDETQVVTVDGAVVQPIPRELHLIMHKAVGDACSHDVDEAPLIYERLDDLWRRAGVQAAGRLDRMTSGLILLSTDGNLLHRLIHPKSKVPRRYRIQYSGTLHRQAVSRVAEGLRLEGDEDRPTAPALLELHGAAGQAPDGSPIGSATMILSEGRYHQVRRMIAALGGAVTALHRDRIGALELPADLPPGGVRPATADELAAAFQAADDAAA